MGRIIIKNWEILGSGLSWLGLIFWFSTETFSVDRTATMMKKILPFLFSSISDEAFLFIHKFLGKAAHLTEYLS